MKNFLLLFSFCLFLNSSNAQVNVKDKPVKDTIFFKIDENYLQPGKYNKDQYYITDALKDNGSSEVFFFQIINNNLKLKPRDIMDLKDFIRKSDYYYSNRKTNKLDDFGLASYLEKYKIYLVDSSCNQLEILEVYPRTEID